jgi:uncharacterized membrane protein
MVGASRRSMVPVRDAQGKSPSARHHDDRSRRNDGRPLFAPRLDLDQFGRVRQRLGAGMSPSHSESHLRSFAKAMSWRATGTLDTFVLSLFFTSSVKLAGSIAATELATKIALYYGHERLWALVRWGRS